MTAAAVQGCVSDMRYAMRSPSRIRGAGFASARGVQKLLELRAGSWVRVWRFLGGRDEGKGRMKDGILDIGSGV